jgi:hypothetical protein
MSRGIAKWILLHLARNCLDFPSNKFRININASHYITERESKMLNVSAKSKEGNIVQKQKNLTSTKETKLIIEPRPAIRLENGSYDEFVTED